MGVLYLFHFYICYLVDFYLVKYRKVMLMALCFSLVLISGLRTPELWADTERYLEAFQNTPTISDISFSNQSALDIYQERGFFVLSSVLKSICNSDTFYLLALSIITICLLYKVSKSYCVYPLIGVCIYISRFYIGRNMIQMRAAIAYLILVYSIQYIRKGENLKYLIIVLMASLIHISSLMFILLLLIYKRGLSNKSLVFLLIIDIILSITLFDMTLSYLFDNTFLGSLLYTYIENENYAIKVGILNPMVLYQSVVLLAYMKLGERISSIDGNYYIIRDAYFMGTLILIGLSSNAVLAGRLSSLFATFEIIIIPSILKVLKFERRKLACFMASVFYSLLFYLNFTKSFQE